MFQNKKQEIIYVLITVIITIPCFVFYCMSIENGGILNVDPKQAIALMPIEFILAFLSDIFIWGKVAAKIAFSKVNPAKDSPLLVELTIIGCTVILMCPWMSFLATILYKGIFPGLIYNDPTFTILGFVKYFIPNFLQTLVQNFPFALIGQVFFIQPLTRKIFGLIFNQKQHEDNNPEENMESNELI